MLNVQNFCLDELSLAERYFSTVHCGAKKLHRFIFCNNVVRTYYSEIVIGTYILQ